MINLMMTILSRVILMVTLLIKKKNFIAKSLKNAKFKQRVVKPKKGTDLSSKIIQQIGARFI